MHYSWKSWINFWWNQLACAVSLAVMKEISKKVTNNVLNLGIFLKKINKILSNNTSVITEVLVKG